MERRVHYLASLALSNRGPSSYFNQDVWFEEPKDGEENCIKKIWNGGIAEWRNGGKWPEILKDGMAENHSKSKKTEL